MRMILAIIQPVKLQAVRDALYAIGVDRMTVCDAQGYGRQRGQPATYRGIEYKVHLLRKIALEIVVNEDFLDRTIETLVRVARTSSEGNIGDGKIFVLPLTESIAIDSLERGPSAVSENLSQNLHRSTNYENCGGFGIGSKSIKGSMAESAMTSKSSRVV